MSPAPRDLVRERRIEGALDRLDAILRQHGDAAFRWLRIEDLVTERAGADPAPPPHRHPRRAAP